MWKVFHPTNLLKQAELALSAPLIPKQAKSPVPHFASITHFGKRHKPPAFKGNLDSLVSRFCKENNFEQAIDILCQQRCLREAIQMLDRLDLLRVRPSANMYSALLKLCLQQGALKEGRAVHSHMKKSGFKPGTVLSNRLIDMYAKCDSLANARQLFDNMEEWDLCSWNIMIAAYARIGELDNALHLFWRMQERDNHSWSTIMSGYVRLDRPKKALELYRAMQKDGSLKDNKFTVSSALATSAAIPSLQHGREIHCHILRNGLASDEIVWSALSDMYAKCGSIEEARFVFDGTSDKDVVSWTTMIGRYLEVGRTKEGLELFANMLRLGARPNEFTFAGVLNACSAELTEGLGKQVHGHMTRVGFDPFSFAASALVDMYSKCGNIESAKRVFVAMPQPDLVTWTSIINGYAQNGQPKEALQHFDLLLNSGIRPDHVTFVGVLSACTHAGFVNKGLEIFHSINEKHGLTHTADHYSCIVDLLARSGKLKEAEDIIDKMPMKPDKFLWSSLLGGCRIYGNIRLAKRAAEALFGIEPENAATYVTMGNIYANAGMWGEVENIRKMMDNKGVVKKPGSSWIEVKRRIHVFLVGDKSHRRTKEIYAFLGKLSARMKEEGYIPDTNYVLHDVEEEQKEQNLRYHSEKLAVAFGIIETPSGTPVKVFKNLRICGDCHTAIEYISRIADREIIVRDSSRFHRFKDGRCSCKGFW